MKNLVLRAMRSFDESLTGPEYACNQLVVEMISDEPLTDTNELDVRIYSADYQLTGSDSRKFSSRKTPLKIRFQLVSDSFWDESLYHVFYLPEWISTMVCCSFSRKQVREMEQNQTGEHTFASGSEIFRRTVVQHRLVA